MRYIVKCSRGKVRKINNDYYLVDNHTNNENLAISQGEIKTAVVFDGVDGLESGDIASRSAAHFIVKENPLLMRSKDEIKLLLHATNNHILDIIRAMEQRKKIATTVAGLHFGINDLIVFNIGDSLVLRYRYKLLQQLSKVHSLSNKLQINDERLKNTIYAYLGKEKIEDEDIYVASYEGGYQSGDYFIIATDGITDYIKFEQLEDILEHNKDVSDIANKIEEIVNHNGAKDNYTLIIIEMMRRDDEEG